MFVPKGILFWVFISNIIVCFDAFFVLNRQETHAGGKYYDIFKPYEHYYKFDKLYDVNDDPFVNIVAWLNLVEAIFSFIGVFLCLGSCKGKKLAGALVCLITSIMVFWKTVIFMWYDYDWLTQDAKDFTPYSILCYYFPNFSLL